MDKLRVLSERLFYKIFIKVIPDKLKRHFIHRARWLFIEVQRRMLHGGRDLPVIIDLETNSLCTRNCNYCPRPKENVTLETGIFYSIIDKLRDWGYQGRISPHAYNEPLTDKRIFDFITYIRKNLLHSEIIFYTNGDLLDNEKIDRLYKVGVTEIKVSLHEPSLAESKIEEFRKRGLTIVDFREGSRVIPLSNRAGNIELKKIIKFSSCYNINAMMIRANGNVVLCCQDSRQDYVFGNVKKEPIEKIWNKPEFKKLRSVIRKGKKPLPICQKCGYEKL